MKKIIMAVVAGYLCAAAWTVYADIVYNNQVPLDAILFHGLYPISLGICAILTALLFDGNVKDIGFNRSGGIYYLQAIGLAAIISILPFLITLVTGFTSLNATTKFDMELIVSGVPVLIILGLGEEMMWRGLLYTNVSRLTGFGGTSLVIGILWALWHYPVIIHTKFIYADRPLWFVLPMFTAVCIFLSFIFNYLRSISRSIWPCVVLHALINYLGFVLVEPMEAVTGDNSFAFRSDIGIVYVLVLGAMAFFLMKRYRRIGPDISAVPVVR